MGHIKRAFNVIGLFVLLCGWVLGQTPAITYQGELKQNGSAAQGTYEMEFRLFDALTDGAQIGSTVTHNSVAVTDGLFSAILDFGAPAFSTGADRYLSISVHKVGDPPGFTLLSPRQPVTSSPYSIRTVSAVSADSLSSACTGCVTDGNIDSVSGAKVTGTVANATNSVTAANVSGIVPITNGGTGSATKNFVDLTTDQNIAGTKVFSGNVFVGGTLNAALGQTTNTVYGTSGLTPTFAFTVLPGVTQTVNVPTGYRAYLQANGGLQTNSAVSTGVSRVDVVLTVDGALTADGNYKRVIAQNTANSTTTIENWSLSTVTQPLSPGMHTFNVMAALQSGDPATISGNNTSVLQAQLTVILIKN